MQFHSYPFFDLSTTNWSSLYGRRLCIAYNNQQTFLHGKAKISHMYGDLNNSAEYKDPVLVTMENEKHKKFQRMLVRTPNGDERVLVPGHGSKAVKVSIVLLV